MKQLRYDLIEAAIQYYKARGFEYIEVPWVVSAKAMNVTVPSYGTKSTSDNCFVASGEQSFMQMILDGALPHGRYCCATPCYRPWDAGKSAQHQAQFFKVELIQYIKDSIYDSMDYWKLRYTAEMFFKRYVYGVRQIDTKDDDRQECTTHTSHDIVTDWGLELGSYGHRSHFDIGAWIYGTGVALPRLQNAMEFSVSR
jgi:hypothetical protein